MPHKPFDIYRANKYSQNGEDGVLFELIKNRLKLEQVNFVEVGAWDGVHLSNTRQFHGQGEGLLIECDASRYEALTTNTALCSPRIRAVHARVEASGKNSLDALIRNSGIPEDITLLSIDLDGPDYLIWDGLKSYRPAIVVIEIDSQPRPGVYMKFGENNMRYTSFSTMLALGITKGYTLICHTGNMIFLRNDLLPLINMPPEPIANPELLFDPSWT